MKKLKKSLYISNLLQLTHMTYKIDKTEEKDEHRWYKEEITRRNIEKTSKKIKMK